MIFAKRYEDSIEKICQDVDYDVRLEIVAVMESFSEPMIIHQDRYNHDNTTKTNAFEIACGLFNHEMRTPYISKEPDLFDPMNQGSTNLACHNIAYIFSVIELQYEELSDDEASEFTVEINGVLSKNNLPWVLVDGKMIKIDSQQFECDLKAKALAQMKELKDAEPVFQSAFTELTTAIEALEKGDYQSAINNAGKSYESVLKVVLGVDNGNANALTNQYMDSLLSVPDTMTKAGFKEKVMMSLPFIRNNSGADHGAGAHEAIISKPMAKLAVNLAAALDTYLIEEYIVSK